MVLSQVNCPLEPIQTTSSQIKIPNPITVYLGKISYLMGHCGAEWETPMVQMGQATAYKLRYEQQRYYNYSFSHLNICTAQSLLMKAK